MASIQCKNCGGSVELPTGRQSATCPYCGGLVERTGNGQPGAGHYMLAKTAFESGNYADAERFCNMHLAQVPDDVDALLLKAQAIGWRQWTGAVRLREVAKNFALALGKVDDADERDELGATIRREFLEIASGKIDEALMHFTTCLSDGNEANLMELIHCFESTATNLQRKLYSDSDTVKIMKKVSCAINSMYVESLERMLIENPCIETYSLLNDQFAKCEKIFLLVEQQLGCENPAVVTNCETLRYFAKVLLNNVGFEFKPDKWGGFSKTPWLSQEQVRKIEERYGVVCKAFS